MESSVSLETYRRNREVLLTSIITDLSADERCVAAWLTGSYARQNANEMSDLDITVVIASPYSDVLCARQEQVSHKTTNERLAFFSKFGEPALVHENNNNAPSGGTFTFVLYKGAALMVDWILVPQHNIQRPFHSLLLFDRAYIPTSPPPPAEDLEVSQKVVAEQWAFFWMMTAITIKYIVRGDLVFVQEWLEHLHGLAREIDRHMERKTWDETYVRGSVSEFQPTRQKQLESLQQLAAQMIQRRARVAEFIGADPVTPISEIDAFVALAHYAIRAS